MDDLLIWFGIFLIALGLGTFISGTNKCLLSNCDMLKKQILDMQDIEALDLLTILDRNVDDLTKVNCLIDSLLN